MPTSSYDIEKIFEDIEEELIASMMRNFKHHQVAEITEGKQWNQWQAEMLQGLEEYKKRNYSKFSKSRKRIDKMLDKALREAGKKGANDEQRKALEALRKGVQIKGSNDGINASFFGINDQKMNALINATTNDLTTARASALRLAEDEYRQTMFKAQAYAASGAGTYEKAVDMATKDFLSKGINSIIYANGARHTISDYAKMAIRTANKRAYLMGAGAKRAEWGVHTVIVNMRNRESACPKCAQFIGKVLVDDVYSGGTAEEAERLGYGLVSEAMEQGLFHPNCKDSLSTYYPELYEDGELPDPADDGLTEEEQLALERNEAIEQKIGNAERIADKYGRLEKYALDNDDKRNYKSKKIEWRDTADEREKELKMSVKDSPLDLGRSVNKPSIQRDKALKDYAREMNVEIVGLKDFVGSPELLISHINRVALLKNEYPSIFKDVVIAFGGRLDSGDIAVMRGNKLVVNQRIYNSREKTLKAMKEIGVNGDTFDYIVDHELGHYLQEKLGIEEKSFMLSVFDRLPQEGVKDLTGAFRYVKMKVSPYVTRRYIVEERQRKWGRKKPVIRYYDIFAETFASGRNGSENPYVVESMRIIENMIRTEGEV